MNGRIYDPTLGRFLQADPFIQAADNSQSYNRYSYMMINPLGGTDPTGYIGKFFKSLIKAAIVGIAAYTGYLAVLQSLGTSVSIAVAGALEQSMIICASSAYVGAAAASGAIAGALNSGTLKGALTGAFSAGTFAAIGGAFSEASGFWKQGGAGHIGAHAITGGILTDLQGGKFGHGFFSAGITKGAQFSGFVPNDAVKGTIASAIVGGTVSRISGGKFANGAGTGAFQFLYNRCFSSGCGFGKKTNEALNKIPTPKVKDMLTLEGSYTHEVATPSSTITTSGVKISTKDGVGMVNPSVVTRFGLPGVPLAAEHQIEYDLEGNVLKNSLSATLGQSVGNENTTMLGHQAKFDVGSVSYGGKGCLGGHCVSGGAEFDTNPVFDYIGNFTAELDGIFIYNLLNDPWE